MDVHQTLSWLIPPSPLDLIHSSIISLKIFCNFLSPSLSLSI